MKERKFVRAYLSVRALAPNYLELHVQFKIHVYECIRNTELLLVEACKMSHLEQN